MFQLFKKKYAVNTILILFLINCTIGWCSNNSIAGNNKGYVNKINEIPFELIGRNILIKAKINNSAKEYSFLLDTGAGMVVISKQVYNELGNIEQSLENKFTDSTNISQKAAVIRITLKLGNTAVSNCRAGILDLHMLEPLKVDGIIGNNLLRLFLVKIDYNQKVLTLSRDIDNNMQPANGFTIKLFQDTTGLILTQIKVGTSSSPVSAVIDTGATGGDYLEFPIDDLEKIKSELNCKLIKSIGPVIDGVFGQTETIYSRLNSVELGSFRAQNIPVVFLNSKHILITNKFLSHFIVIIN
jgi:predicted aspartyl protease